MTDTTNRRQRKTFTGMPVLLAAVLVICLVGYWAQLWMGYDAMRNDVRASTTRLASQSARVLALQVNTLFRKLDYFSQQLSTVWLEGDERLFDRSVLTAMHSLPPNALVQVAVTDARGEVVYSRLEDALVELDPRNPISVADRAHFQAHVMASESFFYVSSPVLGRISKQWTIQFTRGLWEGDTFKGVLVMAVSADHLSAALKATFPDEQDVAVVVREDGAYLARSRKQDEVLGSFVIKERPFLQDTALKSGSYQATAVVDGIKRQYAWWRGDDYPFVVSVGYGEEQALATAEQAITESILQNIISSILLVVGLLVVSRLWFIRSKQAAQLQQVQQRLELAIKGGHLAAWDWDLRNDRLEVNQTWTELFGYDPTRQICTSAEWMSRIHPDDLGRVQAECSAALESDGRIFDLEYRIVLDDGSQRWIADRGQVVQRDPHGQALRMAGIKQDITQRKEVQVAESESRKLLSKLVADVPGAVIQFRRDPDGRCSFPFASPGIERIYNVTAEQVSESAEPVFAMILDQDRERVLESIEHSAETLTDWQAQFRIQNASGEIRWVSGHTHPEKLADGAVVWCGYLQDVTAEIEVAQALKDNEAQLRLTLQAVHDGLWSFDHRTQVATWDGRIRSMLGYEEEELLRLDKDTLLGLLHPQDRERLAVEFWDLFAKHARDVLWMDFRLKTKDGQWLWVQARARVIEWDEHGMPAQTVGILTDISRRVAESQLRQALLNRSPAAIALMGPERQVIEANDRFKALFLAPGRSLKQINSRDLYVNAEHYEQMLPAYEHLSQHGWWRGDVELLTVSGNRGWFDMQGVLQDASDPDSPVIWTMIDISARLAADHALHTERQRLRVLMERFPAGVLIEDSEQKIVFVNERWCDLMGVSADPRSLTDLSRDQVRDLIGQTRAQWHHQSASFVRDEVSRAFEVQDENGHYFEIEFLDVKQAEQQLGTVWFVWDITDRKQHEAQLSRWAWTDGLTSLPNRRSLMQAFERYVSNADHQNPQYPGVLMMLDIDHFKKVNDTYGHSVGDLVLKQLAQTMRDQIRDQDCAARLGGEEFALLLPNVALNQGVAVAERVRQHVQQSMLTHADVVIQITVSLGVTVIDGTDLEEMLKQADKALYRAKQTGRNKVCVWGVDVS